MPLSRSGKQGWAKQFDVHANQIASWRTQLLEGAGKVFGGDSKAEAAASVNVKELRAKIRELTLTSNFFAGALTKRDC